MTLFDHRGFFALIEQFLADPGGVYIQKQQYHKGDDNIYHGITELGTAVAEELIVLIF